MPNDVKRFVVDIQGREARECVFAADHDRIVSALTEAGVKMQAERDKWQQEAIRIARAVCALGKMEFDQLTDDSKLIEVMSIIREAIQERDTLRAEVELLRKDAERYRLLRAGNDYQYDGPMVVLYEKSSDVGERPYWSLAAEALDETIDAALEASR